MPQISSRDRLIVALDMPTVDDARKLVSGLGDSVTFYKVGLELLFGGGLSFVEELRALHKQVFLDLKLLDIGNTVERAVANAAELGVTFLTVHGTDRKTLKAAVSGRGKSQLKLLAVTVLTNLDSADLAEQGSQMEPQELVLHRARMAFETGFDGVISSGQEASKIRAATAPDFKIVTPGIRLMGGAAGDQMRITTPLSAISAGADYLVVGRPITEASDPIQTVEAFVRQIDEASGAASNA